MRSDADHPRGSDRPARPGPAATSSRDHPRGSDRPPSDRDRGSRRPSGPALPTGISAPAPPVRLRGRRATAVGLALSALAHVLAVVVYSFSTAPAGSPALPPASPPLPSPDGIEVVRLVEVEGQLPGDPTDPSEIETPDDPDVAPELQTFEDEGPRFPGRYRSAAERLRAVIDDPRLLNVLDPGPIEPTPEEALELRILAAIEAMNDSATAEAARARAALDWTHTDEDGGKWGVTPGRLHLGDITIPLPFGFGPPPDYDGDRAEMAFRLSDIDRAAGSTAARQSWKERAEVMRQRREARRQAEIEAKAKAEAETEAEEEEAEGEEGKPPPVIKPDTTRTTRSR